MSRKLTIIKVLGKKDGVTAEDLEKWREIFRTHQMTEEEAAATGEISIEHIPVHNEDNEHFITFVRLGGDNYKPSIQDLESWRDVFKDAEKDPDFKIFTHTDVDISVIAMGKIIAVE